MYMLEQAEFDALTDLTYRWSVELSSMSSGTEAKLKATLLGGLMKLRGQCTGRDNIAAVEDQLGGIPLNQEDEESEGTGNSSGVETEEGEGTGPIVLDSEGVES
jgi:hypothetical protein